MSLFTNFINRYLLSLEDVLCNVPSIDRIVINLPKSPVGSLL